MKAVGVSKGIRIGRHLRWSRAPGPWVVVGSLTVLFFSMLLVAYVLLSGLQSPDRSFGDLQSMTGLVALVFMGWCAFQIYRKRPR